MTNPEKIRAIVLAGDRGSDDPLLVDTNVTRKALLPIAGQPMISHVLDVLGGMDEVADITVVANKVADFKPVVPDTVHLEEGEGSPTASLVKALEGKNFPVLVVTADHPLLSKGHINDVLKAPQHDQDMLVALARRSDFEELHLNVRRTFYSLGKEGYSGCNIFLVLSEQAADVIKAWGSRENKRKNAFRLLWSFGPMAAIRAFLGWLNLEDALKRISKVFGANIGAVILVDAWAAMDVDRQEHIAPVAKELVKRKKAM